MTVIRLPAPPSSAVPNDGDSHLVCIEQDPERQAAFVHSAAAAQIVYAEGVQSERAAQTIAEATGRAPTFITFDCAPQLHALSRLGGLPSNNPGCMSPAIKAHIQIIMNNVMVNCKDRFWRLILDARHKCKSAVILDLLGAI